MAARMPSGSLVPWRAAWYPHEEQLSSPLLQLLSEELLLQVLRHAAALDIRSLGSLRATCRRLCRIAHDPALLREFHWALVLAQAVPPQLLLPPAALRLRLPLQLAMDGRRLLLCSGPRFTLYTTQQALLDIAALPAAGHDDDEEEEEDEELMEEEEEEEEAADWQPAGPNQQQGGSPHTRRHHQHQHPSAAADEDVLGQQTLPASAAPARRLHASRPGPTAAAAAGGADHQQQQHKSHSPLQAAATLQASPPPKRALLCRGEVQSKAADPPPRGHAARPRPEQPSAADLSAVVMADPAAAAAAAVSATAESAAQRLVQAQLFLDQAEAGANVAADSGAGSATAAAAAAATVAADTTPHSVLPSHQEQQQLLQRRRPPLLLPGETDLESVPTAPGLDATDMDDADVSPTSTPFSRPHVVPTRGHTDDERGWLRYDSGSYYRGLRKSSAALAPHRRRTSSDPVAVSARATVPFFSTTLSSAAASSSSAAAGAHCRSPLAIVPMQKNTASVVSAAASEPVAASALPGSEDADQPMQDADQVQLPATLKQRPAQRSKRARVRSPTISISSEPQINGAAAEPVAAEAGAASASLADSDDSDDDHHDNLRPYHQPSHTPSMRNLSCMTAHWLPFLGNGGCWDLSVSPAAPPAGARMPRDPAVEADMAVGPPPPPPLADEGVAARSDLVFAQVHAHRHLVLALATNGSLHVFDTQTGSRLQPLAALPGERRISFSIMDNLITLLSVVSRNPLSYALMQTLSLNMQATPVRLQPVNTSLLPLPPSPNGYCLMQRTAHGCSYTANAEALPGTILVYPLRSDNHAVEAISKPLTRLVGHQHWVTDMSCYDTMLASASNRDCVCLWAMTQPGFPCVAVVPIPVLSVTLTSERLFCLRGSAILTWDLTKLSRGVMPFVGALEGPPPSASAQAALAAAAAAAALASSRATAAESVRALALSHPGDGALQRAVEVANAAAAQAASHAAAMTAYLPRPPRIAATDEMLVVATDDGAVRAWSSFDLQQELGILCG